MPVGEIKSQLPKYDVISIGSGLSQDPGAILMFKAILFDLKDTETPVVIDADGLNIISKFPKIKLPKNVIFTPHIAEASRLSGQKVEDILRNHRFTAKKNYRKIWMYNCFKITQNNCLLQR